MQALASNEVIVISVRGREHHVKVVRRRLNAVPPVDREQVRIEVGPEQQPRLALR